MDLRQIQALISVQMEKLDDYTITAPMDGVVLRRDGEVGEIAEAGQILFRVGVPKPLQVVAEVNEEDIPRVAVGQTVLLRTDAFPDRRLEGKVREITPMGDAVAKTYRIRIALPDDTPLQLGMSVEANVVTREKADALLSRPMRCRATRCSSIDGDRVAQAAGRGRHPRHAQRRGPLRPRRRRARRLAAPTGPRRTARACRRSQRPEPMNLVLDIA